MKIRGSPHDSTHWAVSLIVERRLSKQISKWIDILGRLVHLKTKPLKLILLEVLRPPFQYKHNASFDLIFKEIRTIIPVPCLWKLYRPIISIGLTTYYLFFEDTYMDGTVDGTALGFLQGGSNFGNLGFLLVIDW